MENTRWFRCSHLVDKLQHGSDIVADYIKQLNEVKDDKNTKKNQDQKVQDKDGSDSQKSWYIRGKGKIHLKSKVITRRRQQEQKTKEVKKILTKKMQEKIQKKDEKPDLKEEEEDDEEHL